MNNDLISRKWLTDAIRNRRTYLSYEDAKDVIDLIDNAPTVKTYCYFCGQTEHGQIEERPQGEWIFLGKDEVMKVECPFCHKRKCCVSNYCDYCGAKMKGDAEE